MTAGEDAMREAARLEAASFYGRVMKPSDLIADEHALAEANQRAILNRRRTALLRDLRGGMSSYTSMRKHSVTYETVQAARAHLRKGDAA